MTTLYDLRKAIRTLLTSGHLWTADEIIIRRRGKVWNDVATAVQSSKYGQCLVIGTAKGDPEGGRDSSRRASVSMELTIPVTLIELPNIDPDEEEEDTRWQQTVALLQGSPLGRSEDHYWLSFAGFDDLEDKSYVIRQTLFKTGFLITPENTPQPEPPDP